MQIGDRISARRKELGMTQEELARLMGYKSKAAISKIETNVNDITQSTVVKFAEVLQTSIAYLMGWEEEKAQPAQEDDAELLEYLEYLRTRPEARILMSTMRGATKEEVEENVRFIEALRKSRHAD
jgi:transcriptional regulator with XRE-family HTH domain